MFDYVGSDLAKVVEKVKSSSRQSVTEARKYHSIRNNVEVVAKIDRARLIAKRDAAIARVAVLSEAVNA